MVKWGLITFGIGMIFMVLDIMMARKQKGGMTFTDRKRITGIFWLSLFAGLGVAGIIWMAP